MKLGKGIKLLIGILTIWMPLYMIGFFVFFITSFLESHDHTVSKGVPTYFTVMMTLHVFTILLSLALAVFYIAHAVKNPKVKQDNRIIWVLVLLMGGIVAMPIYWYIHIWKEPAVTSESAQSTDQRVI
jgi:hypothetical protein